MSLNLAHPHLPPCSECKKYVFDKQWRPTRQRGSTQQMLRPKHMTTPCSTCPKIPRGADPKPENAVSLSDRNAKALWYYHLCKQDRLQVLPEDETTIANNAVIQSVIDRHQRSIADIGPLLLAAMTMK